jgi:hypothetical protein
MRWPWNDLQEATLMRGTFLDPLVLKTKDRELGFDVFKVKKPARDVDFNAAWQSQ